MISIKNLVKKYGEKVAVDNLNLEIESGDIFAFIGHNGAGKTTTIKCIVGINDFDFGDVLIDNVSIKNDPMKCKQMIAYVPDNPDIYNSLTGIQYINLVCDIYKVDKVTRKNLTTKYATDLELINNLNDPISTYSHGMKQKLVLISAFVHSPKVLVLDEPFVGLDPKASFAIKSAMKEFAKNGGTIFFSTHVLEVAEKLCNKVAIIKSGKLVVCGTMEEIRRDKSLESVFLESANE